VRAVSGSALLADAGRSAPAPITHPWARRARLLAADAAVRLADTLAPPPSFAAGTQRAPRAQSRQVLE